MVEADETRHRCLTRLTGQKNWYICWGRRAKRVEERCRAPPSNGRQPIGNSLVRAGLATYEDRRRVRVVSTVDALIYPGWGQSTICKARQYLAHAVHSCLRRARDRGLVAHEMLARQTPRATS